MRKMLLLAVLAVLVLASLPVAQAEEMGTGKWTFNGQLRTREEHLENYADFDNNGATTDLVDFMPYRANIGVHGQLANNVSLAFSFQSFGAWGFNGDPRQSSSFPPNQQSFTTSPESSTLYQGNVVLDKFIGDSFKLTAGRQEHMEGTGLIFGNEEFYNGTVYDGFDGEWKFKKWELTGVAFIINEQFGGGLVNGPLNPVTPGLPVCTNCGSEDTRVWGATGHLHFGKKMKSDLDVYAYDAYDGVAGNPAPVPPATTLGKPHFQTYGGHWSRVVKTQADAKAGHLDWNLEIAVQSGDITDSTNNNQINTSGAIIDGSVGWNFGGGKTVQRVYIGATRESGDDDLTNNKVDGWTDLFMSVHGRFGAADFFGSNFSAHAAGITAWKAGYTASLKDGKHTFGAALWSFMPTEDSIDTGAGTVKVEDYGTEIDLGYKYRYTDNVTFGAGIAQLSPDDGLTGGSGAPDDAVLRAVGVLDVKFK